MKIKLEFDDESVQQAFNRLRHFGADISPVTESIGEALLNTTRERFIDQQSPDGETWAPLSAVTKARKKNNTDKILTEDGYLFGSLAYQANRQQVLIGSTLVYAEPHQFGATKGAHGNTKRGAPIPWGDIPARPFLGISKDDASTFNETVRDFIDDLLTPTK